MKTGGRSIICSFIATGLGYSESDLKNSKNIERVWNVYTGEPRSLDFGKFKVFNHGCKISEWSRIITPESNFFGVSHFRAADEEMIKATKNFFTFTCLRHPVSRFLSRYKETVLAKEGRKLEKHTVHNSGLKDAVGEGIVRFAEKIEKHQLYEQLYFFSDGNVEEAYENIKKMNLIMFSESMYKGIKTLSKLINVDLPYIEVGKTGGDNKNFVSEKDLLILLDMLSPEIKFYNRVRTLCFL